MHGGGGFSGLGGIINAMEDISIALEHSQFTDDIPHTNHDIPNAPVISSDAMNTP